MCGNGVSSSDEECDDGNQNDADACRNDCTQAACGDGVQRTDLLPGDPNAEACDDGNLINGDGCQDNCKLPNCGDGSVDPGEECDDENGNELMGVSAPV